MSPELAQAIIASARRLQVSPVDLATAISYETGGRYDPNLWGGKGGNYLGLIQFGPEERQRYGVREGQSAPEQMQAVESFLRDRGVRPGMGLLDIYSTINAGAPGLYNRSDAANGGAPGTVADKVAGMAQHANSARALLGQAGMLSPSAQSASTTAAAGSAPNPGAAPESSSSPARPDDVTSALQSVAKIVAPQQPPPVQFDFSPTPGMIRARQLALAMLANPTTQG